MIKQIYILILFCTQPILFVSAQTIDLDTPVGSGRFGTHVSVLPNGNYVVTDPYYDDGALIDAGAFYLYEGLTHQLIGLVKGSHINDMVGNGGITVLKNGNFLVSSTKWNDNAGAVTWGSQSVGIHQIISASNSLLGYVSSLEARHKITIFDDGNFLVSDTTWNNSRGAVTWGSGTGGISGTISSSNSLLGSNANDKAGRGIVKLSGLKYAIISDKWNSGRGAVTVAGTNSGIMGEVTAVNSLVGDNAGDAVGSSGVTLLPSNNFLVRSPSWNGLGAITFCKAASNTAGVVSELNSLTGSFSGDFVGKYSVAVLQNGNYIVRIPEWNSATGAVVWGSGVLGITGKVSVLNALTGTAPGEKLGNEAVTELTNGNYVVNCRYCNGGNSSVTWGSGLSGIIGPVSVSNSLWDANKDFVNGFLDVTALKNGNYLVSSPYWNGNRGSVTWADGTTGFAGTINSQNSLVGERAGESIGTPTILALSNGNYVINSEDWNGYRGAITWADGSTGIKGFISESNSLVGSSAIDFIGSSGVIELANGNYVVASPYWYGRTGAITWGNGKTGIFGRISAANSLTGSYQFSDIGINGVRPLLNGNYVAFDPDAAQGRGLIVWGNGTSGSKGLVTSANALTGSTSGDKIGGGDVVFFRFSGSYLVISPKWNQSRGAATLIDGSKAVSGIVSNENSLVGANPGDKAGIGSVFFGNGNYLIESNNQNEYVGALTWGDSITGVSGVFGSSNSLISRNTREKLGATYKSDWGIKELPDGNYLLTSSDAGLNTETITFVDGSAAITGYIPFCTSITSIANTTGPNLVSQYNGTLKYLVVGRPNENKVSILDPATLPLAHSSDQASRRVGGLGKVHFRSSQNCAVIASISSTGNKPAYATVEANVYTENEVLQYDNKSYVQRHYQIVPSTTLFPSVRVTLYFSQTEFNAFNELDESSLKLPKNQNDANGKSNLVIFAFDGRSADNTGLPETYLGSALKIKVAPQDIVWNSLASYWEVSFDNQGKNGFFLSTESERLPVRLTQFSGNLTEGNAVLSWETAEEINLEGFVLERSLDTRQFKVIESFQASNGPGQHKYSYLDAGVSKFTSENIYYRLKMTDLDGNFAYSKIVTIHLALSESVYPNPTVDQAFSIVSTSENEIVNISLTDVNGRVIHHAKQQMVKGENKMAFDVKTLPAGTYIISIEGKTIHTRRRLTKQ